MTQPPCLQHFYQDEQDAPAYSEQFPFQRFGTFRRSGVGDE